MSEAMSMYATTADYHAAINERVAREVMGWVEVPVPLPLRSSGDFGIDTCWKCPKGKHWPILEDFTTDIAAAWLVVERMDELGWFIALDNDAEMNHGRTWAASFEKQQHSYEALADTTPLAICLAALSAMEGKW